MTDLAILASPFDVYHAPVGEAFPTVDATPGGNWVIIGSSGALHQNEDGVTLTLSQDFEEFRSAGETMIQEVTRISEDFMVSFTLVNLTASMLSLIFNSNTVTDNAPGTGTTVGFKEVDMRRGPGKPTERALLIRGTNTSPELATGNSQFEIPRCFLSSSPEPQFSKNVFSGVEFEFKALKAASAPFAGRYLYQDE